MYSVATLGTRPSSPWIDVNTGFIVSPKSVQAEIPPLKSLSRLMVFDYFKVVFPHILSSFSRFYVHVCAWCTWEYVCTLRKMLTVIMLTVMRETRILL